MDHVPEAGGDWRALARVPYFSGLSTRELRALRQQCLLRTLQAGETVLLEGEPAEGLYLVLSGSVRVYKSSPEGREQVLIVIGPGGTFNEVPAFDGGPNPANVQAASGDTVLCIVPAKQIARLLATSPIVAANATRVFAARLRHLAALVEDLSLHPTVQRVAKLLLDESLGGTRAVQLTQQDMAARVGTAREVVSRALAELERRGAIAREAGRSITIDAAFLKNMVLSARE